MAAANLVVLGWIAAAAVMAALWFLQRATRDAGVVDAGWAGMLGVLALLYAVLGHGEPWRRALVAALAGAWSLRLATYVLTNRVLGRTEDGRYRTLRSAWGERAQRRFFVFFQAQAILDVLFSLPFLVAMANPRPDLGGWGAAGVLVWLTAVVGETVADRQLAAFRADPANRGRTCRTGLWRLSRHPNYFFEWVHWWAYVLLAVGSRWWPAALLGPALMAFFLVKVTGIPATEAQAVRSRPDYAEYRRTTSAFIPWFPKRTGSGQQGPQPTARR